ncbi:hypothetical protein QF037_006819 [Streptomyces canus]|nr:hypothetical protein [Streptomyces canus]
MEILAFGVQADEKPLIQQAFRGHHEVRCLDVFLNEDTAPIAAGYEVISTASTPNSAPVSWRSSRPAARG